MSEIIKKSDPRFKNLEIIFNKYNQSNLTYNTGKSIYYFIPPELLKSELILGERIELKFDPKNPDESNNWVYCGNLKEALQKGCDLTSQEYYDLCILHINNTEDRPKCMHPACDNYLIWTGRISHGYFNHGNMHGYCSKSCELSHLTTLTDIEIRANYSNFLALGNIDDECYFYIAELPKSNRIKYGITSDVDNRLGQIMWFYGEPVTKIDTYYTGTRFEVANLEAKLKLHFKSTDEFLDASRFNELIELISELSKKSDISPFPNITEKWRSNKLIHQCRACAPDKAMMWTAPYYKLIKHDHTNLVDFTKDQLQEIFDRAEYILPADEGDIRYANQLGDFKNVDQSFILLPHENIGEGYCKVIDYDKYVPKNSYIYEHLTEETGVIYQPYHIVSSEVLRNKLYLDKMAIKTLTGSGSRGVLLIDKDRVHLGGKYIESVNQHDLNAICDFADKEGCDIMLQELIPYDKDLTKVNIDFIIREGKLLGYKWTITDPEAVFTNWNWGYHVYDEYTEEIMTKLSAYLTKNGIWNAIMNFEAFSDMKSRLYLVEFNWRYSNSTFEGEAAGIDLVAHYLNNTTFATPAGKHKFVRYWRCAYYDDIIK